MSGSQADNKATIADVIGTINKLCVSVCDYDQGLVPIAARKTFKFS